MADSYQPGVRSKAKRAYKRASYDYETVHAVFDDNPMCHVGYVIDGQPYVTPTTQWRRENRLYWHGSSAGRMIKILKDGAPCCVTVSEFNGYVMARSQTGHSANYRSAMAFGTCSSIEDRDEKEEALYHMFEHLYPGRWDDVRGLTEQELKATTVIVMEIEEASAKVRTGLPADNDEDYANIDCWAGVLPVVRGFGPPEDDGRLKDGITFPDNLKAFKP
jgi:uncharacterized protein